MKRLNGLAAALLLLWLGGCKGGGSGGPSTVTDFCSQYADEVCQIATTCAVPMTTCLTYEEGVCQTLATTATSGGKRVYTPGNAGDCLNKLKSAYASTNPITPETQKSIDLACRYVFQGKVMPLADPCVTQFDCAGTTDGTIICDPVQHLCATATTVAGGKQCNDVGDVCAQNFYCAQTSANVSICTADGTSGAASTCSATLPCDSNSRCATGTCMPLVAAGGACTADSDCASNGYCDPYGPSPQCDSGLAFANHSPSCLCIAEGMSCPGGSGGGGGGGAGGGATGAAGAAGGASGAAGTAGAAGGASGSAASAGGTGGIGTGGAAGGAGAAGGPGGAAGSATGDSPA
jgi:hypothetical protein